MWLRDTRFPVAQSALPENVRRLIAEHITSVEQLEVLLLLARSDGRRWTPEAVSEELRTSVTSARARLGDLERRGFLSSTAEGCRFEPSVPQAREAVEALAATYAERRYTVIDLIFSKPIDNLRVYANAFRFRKDDPDG